MSFLITILAFVFVLGIIIFVHEFGHLITAKAFGMRVFVFSFGFGKRLFGFQWGDTDCRVSAVPLGGYVKLEGEGDDIISEDTSERGDGRDFLSRPRWQRFLVYVAGPAMNAVLTITVLSVLFVIGTYVAGAFSDRPIIGAVASDSPAERAGMVPGDEILAIGEETVESWQDAQYLIAVQPEASLTLRVQRDGQHRNVEVLSEATDREKVGHIGVYPLVRVGEVLEGSPAEGAGLQTDDAILRIGDTTIENFTDIIPVVQAAEGALTFRIWREGQQLDVDITPRDDGSGLKVGIAPKFTLVKVGPTEAVSRAVSETWKMTTQTFDVLGRLLTGQISPKTMMGPVGIAQISGQAAQSGAEPLFRLVAIISLQVGILNLLPLAPLDGGHLAIIAVEGVVRRDLSPNIKNWIMNAGAAAIFLLIGLVIYSDISKLSFVRGILP